MYFADPETGVVVEYEESQADDCLSQGLFQVADEAVQKILGMGAILEWIKADCSGINGNNISLSIPANKRPLSASFLLESFEEPYLPIVSDLADVGVIDSDKLCKMSVEDIQSIAKVSLEEASEFRLMVVNLHNSLARI